MKGVSRSGYSQSLQEFLKEPNKSILGKLAKTHGFTLDEDQRNAWEEEIEILKDQLQDFKTGHIILEYTIPRMGKRVDVVFIYDDLIFVIEFKSGKNFQSGDEDQCVDYALDLKNFHEQSHNAKLVPILVAVKAKNTSEILNKPNAIHKDMIFDLVHSNSILLGKKIQEMVSIASDHNAEPINSTQWENSRYHPTPTIIEAAQALYNEHDVEEISRSDAKAKNLKATTKTIQQVINESKKNGEKSICFVTGVPGSGKTLAGLNIAYQSGLVKSNDANTRAVFLSGNGPLVEVLQEALAKSKYEKDKLKKRGYKSEARRLATSFIQNIHHFRDDALVKEEPPNENVVIFDEAQRAWNKAKLTDFMKRKKNRKSDTSEPEFLISVMDRHKKWSVIVCLIGGGQEINTGEAGLPEWFHALKNKYPHWNVYISEEITDKEYVGTFDLKESLTDLKPIFKNDLHLKTSMRSFRSDNVSKLVKTILDRDYDEASDIYKKLDQYPIKITRDPEKAKEWMKKMARGSERYGLIASSKACRLKPFGIYVDYKINRVRWFLDSKDDVRSSYYLEYVATEFDIQGLELDWVCVAWDGDLRTVNDDWSYNEFVGNRWQKIHKDERIQYLINAYRVLLTRARQGMVIFVPCGDQNDTTRKPQFYDSTFEYLKKIGLEVI